MITGMKTIHQRWLDYQKHAVNPTASANQVKETHQAYMAGFITCFMLMERIGSPDISETEGLEIMVALKAEVDQFVVAKFRQAGK